ncbi:MAG: DUF4139 domain-containing protein [Sandaracinaceae bacterium]
MTAPDILVLPRESLPIVEVTVLEDRARVKRRGRIEVAAGTSRLTLPGVATVIVDRTLAGYVRALPDGVREPIGSLRVQRERLHETSALPAELAALEVRLEETRHRIASLEAGLRELDAYVGSLAAIAKLAVDDTVTDAAHGLGTPALWRERFASLDDASTRARQERLELEAALADAQAELVGLEREHHAKRTVTTRERATLSFAVARAAPGMLEVEVDYVVGNACWRPLHRAELSDDGSLTVRTDACIWQHTGEDWPEVALVCSTERSARDASPPRLETDRLAVRRKSTVTSVAVRSQEIATTGQGSALRTEATELPGVDDGGDVQRLAPAARVTVLGDGRPHRVELGRFETRAELSLRAVPEVNAAVLRRSVQVNTSARPLLAGPVELVRGGGLIGRTSVRFVAPEERFELGWGPEGALRLFREETTRPGDPGLLSSQRVTLVDRTLRISNLGAAPLVFEILERIPVSELEKVKITLDPRRSTHGATADEDGMVRLPVRLGPRSTTTVTLGFEVRAAADVVGLPY